MANVRTRFAPSPTGYMHVGNLRTALYTYLQARHNGGTFILRIEDTDQGRLVEGATDIIYNTLKATGLTWDEGPDIGGPVGPYVQSERMGMFKQYAEQLVKAGQAYYCFCTPERLEEMRQEQLAKGASATRYDGHCRDLPPEEVQRLLDAGTPYVIRQKMPREGVTGFDDAVYGHIEVNNSELEDQILIKTDGMPTYNFANVVDDHLMGITHVIRGSEYLSSTPKYNLLYQAFGWDLPIYIHCPPVMKDAQHKLSKRNGDASYQDLLAKGCKTGKLDPGELSDVVDTMDLDGDQMDRIYDSLADLGIEVGSDEFLTDLPDDGEPPLEEIDEIEEEGVLEEQESDLVRSALEFDDKNVSEVLIPRVRITAVEKNDSLEHIRELFFTEQYSRMPVYEKNIDNIIGFIHERDFFKLTVSDEHADGIESIIHEVIYITEFQTVSEVLARMQKEKIHMAIIKDQYGGTYGMVTMEDLIEELLGEIYDETDEEDHSFIKISDNEYDAAADFNLREFEEKLGLPEDTIKSESYTLGGWALELFGRIPQAGDEVKDGVFTLKVLEAEENRIIRLKITVDKPDESENKDSE